jgi:hypothetical protein
MIRTVKIGLVTVAALAVGVIGATLFIESGYYNIGADDHHTKLVLTLIEELRERSIGARAHTIDLRYVEEPEKIAVGAQHYAALCVGCHLAPGITKSEIRPDSTRTRQISRKRICMTAGGHFGLSNTASK